MVILISRGDFKLSCSGPLLKWPVFSTAVNFMCGLVLSTYKRFVLLFYSCVKLGVGSYQTVKVKEVFEFKILLWDTITKNCTVIRNELSMLIFENLF